MDRFLNDKVGLSPYCEELEDRYEKGLEDAFGRSVSDPIWEAMIAGASSQDERWNTAFGSTPIYKTGYEDYSDNDNEDDDKSEEVEKSEEDEVEVVHKPHARLTWESKANIREGKVREVHKGHKACTSDHRRIGLKLEVAEDIMEDLIEEPIMVAEEPPKARVVSQLAVQQARLKLFMRKGMNRTEAIEEVMR